MVAWFSEVSSSKRTWPIRWLRTDIEVRISWSDSELGRRAACRSCGEWLFLEVVVDAIFLFCSCVVGCGFLMVDLGAVIWQRARR